MSISKEQFTSWVQEAIDSLPQETIEKTHNVAFLVEDHPTKEQVRKGRIPKDQVLLGLYEGYRQSSRQNFGPVLPDRITLFRKPICSMADSEQAIKAQILATLKHEIAHHFGSDETGARKAGKMA